MFCGRAELRRRRREASIRSRRNGFWALNCSPPDAIRSGGGNNGNISSTPSSVMSTCNNASSFAAKADFLTAAMMECDTQNRSQSPRHGSHTHVLHPFGNAWPKMKGRGPGPPSQFSLLPDTTTSSSSLGLVVSVDTSLETVRGSWRRQQWHWGQISGTLSVV